MMDAIKQRLVSRDQVMITFAVIVFVVHIWSIYNLLVEVPAWLLRLSSWELVGVISYTLVFALIESLIILIILVFVATILPECWFRQRFVAISSLFVFLAAIWVIPVHLYEDAIRSWGIPGAMVFISLVFVTFVAVNFFVFRSTRFENKIVSIMQRITVLAILYLMIDLIAFMIVLGRNVIG
jgi:hypothetical protein